MLWTEVYEVLIGCLTHIRLGNEGILIETWCFTSSKFVWVFKSSLWSFKVSSLCPWPQLDCVNCSSFLQMGQQEICRCTSGAEALLYPVLFVQGHFNMVILSGFKNRQRVFLACRYKSYYRHQLQTAVTELLSLHTYWMLLHQCRCFNRSYYCWHKEESLNRIPAIQIWYRLRF